MLFSPSPSLHAIALGLGPTWVKLGGRVRYDETDVDAYVKANKRIPSVRAAMEGIRIGNFSA
jgi:hypothetical protein